MFGAALITTATIVLAEAMITTPADVTQTIRSPPGIVYVEYILPSGAQGSEVEEIKPKPDYPDHRKPIDGVVVVRGAETPEKGSGGSVPRVQIGELPRGKWLPYGSSREGHRDARRSEGRSYESPTLSRSHREERSERSFRGRERAGERHGEGGNGHR